MNTRLIPRTLLLAALSWTCLPAQDATLPIPEYHDVFYRYDAAANTSNGRPVSRVEDAGSPSRRATSTSFSISDTDFFSTV